MSTDKQAYDYGRCDVCDTPMQERTVTQDFWVNGELVVIRNVRAGVCPQCGEKIVNAEVGEQILELLQRPEYAANAPRMSVPVLMFDEHPARIAYA